MSARVEISPKILIPLQLLCLGLMLIFSILQKYTVRCFDYALKGGPVYGIGL